MITGLNKILQPCNLCEKTFSEWFYHHYSYLALINFYISIYLWYSSTFIFLRNCWYFIYNRYLSMLQCLWIYFNRSRLQNQVTFNKDRQLIKYISSWKKRINHEGRSQLLSHRLYIFTVLPSTRYQFPVKVEKHSARRLKLHGFCVRLSRYVWTEGVTVKIFLHFQIKSGRMDGSSLLQNLTGSHRVCFLYYRHTFDLCPMQKSQACFGIVTFTLKIESHFLCWCWRQQYYQGITGIL